MACPFGFAHEQADQHYTDDDIAEPDASRPSEKLVRTSGLARVDQERNPVQWFYQNQLRSEEEFQRNKEKLRKEARHQLDVVFNKKNKALIVDTDEDNFSIDSSELSAWDSDVRSLASMASCANSWIEESKFMAPAQTTMSALLVALLVAGVFSAWQAQAAMGSSSQYWGLIRHGWTPAASATTATCAAALAVACLGTLHQRSKRLLLAFQLSTQALYVVAAGLAVATLVAPPHIDHLVMHNACKPTDGPGNRLCSSLPAVERVLKATMTGMALGNAAVAVVLSALLMSSCWVGWELGMVAQKAVKHKRRRRHRKHSIPWDKIKLEDIGPATFCGTAPSSGLKATAGHGTTKGGAAARRSSGAATKMTSNKKVD